MVIGLNLCPFARRVFDGNKIRFTVTDVTTAADLLAVMTAELESLAGVSGDGIETTIVIHPAALCDFLDYNDFLAVLDRRIEALGLDGVIQAASFHPEYQFAGTDAAAAENYTNRSPYPMLHLLREDSITRLGATTAELAAIPRRNIATLKKMGVEKILERLSARVPS